MKKFKTILIVFSVTAVLITGTLGVLAYASKIREKQETEAKTTVESIQNSEENYHIKANSVAELFAEEGVIIDYNNAPEDMRKLMRPGESFSYNGYEYNCFSGFTYGRTKHAFRSISKKDAEKILNYEDLETCSYYEAECIYDLLSGAMEQSVIHSYYPETRNWNVGICETILFGEKQILFVIRRTGITAPIIMLKRITYAQAEEENLLFPNRGEEKCVCEEEEYVETFVKIRELCNFPEWIPVKDRTIKGHSVPELFAGDDVIIDYDNAPEDVKELIIQGEYFLYNGLKYRVYPDQSAVRVITATDAKIIMGFKDIEECSSFKATCILRMLSEALESGAISTGSPEQNSNDGFTIHIFEENDRVLFACCATGDCDREAFIRTFDRHELEGLNLLMPNKGDIAYLSVDDTYLDTFCKILELCGLSEEVTDQFRDAYSSK